MWSRSLAPRALRTFPSHHPPAFLPPRPTTPFASTLQLQLQRRDLSDQARSAIDQAIQASPLVVFMKGHPDAPQCGFSRAVVQILEVQGVAPDQLHTYNCLDDQELREGIKEYSDWPTIPQVYLKGEFLGGCDILMGMHSSGELEALLVKEGVIPAEVSPAQGETGLSDGSAEPRGKQQ